MTPELLGNEEKYNLHSQEVHLVMMISWGVVIRDGLIIRKFEYAKMIYIILHTSHASKG